MGYYIKARDANATHILIGYKISVAFVEHSPMKKNI